jgi:hypothetical protein
MVQELVKVALFSEVIQQSLILQLLMEILQLVENMEQELVQVMEKALVVLHQLIQLLFLME